MSEDTVKIEVDGQELEARKGSMLIEATDAAGIYVPRFCYHKNLSVAANCRMCLVEVERAPKPMPACATPVMDGMKVFTRSEKAVAAQHATMEFLLINHPLDCPICDQGGECELQDLAMGYGSDVSRFSESKRVVRDKDIGPLVQTDMTRCIHCTRCVRFGEEIAGLRELGATGRGEHMEIGTYVQKAMTSELSGNVIDLCPVGALTNKPYRYSARAWELKQVAGVSSHDGLGSNLNFHVKGQAIKRVVPRENDAVNESWLSDRDRYSHFGLSHPERLLVPKLKRNGRWAEVDWETALDFVCEHLAQASQGQVGQLVTLMSPSCTNEELLLAQALVRGLGSDNIDHRLRQSDFTGQDDDARFPSVPELEQIEKSGAAILIGAHPRHEQPLLNLRLRKAALRGAAVVSLDVVDRDFNYAITGRHRAKPSLLPNLVASLVVALGKAKSVDIPEHYLKIVDGLADPALQETLTSSAALLAGTSNAVVLTGAVVEASPCRGVLMVLSDALAAVLSARRGDLASGGNAAGAWLAGAVPHRGAGGEPVAAPGMSSKEMVKTSGSTWMLFGFDPSLDTASAAEMLAALQKAGKVIAFSAYNSETLVEYADCVLPIAAPGENEGSFVNLNGRLQRFVSAIAPAGQARAGWKILRVLGNRLNLPGFDMAACTEVTDRFVSLVGDFENIERRLTDRAWAVGESDEAYETDLEVFAEVPMYAVDQLVRHAEPLQAMPQSGDDTIRLAPVTAAKLGLAPADRVTVTCGTETVELRLAVDSALEDGVCAVAGARALTARVAVNGARVKLQRVVGDAAA